MYDEMDIMERYDAVALCGTHAMGDYEWQIDADRQRDIYCEKERKWLGNYHKKYGVW